MAPAWVPAADLVIQAYAVITVFDVLVAWVQEEPRRWPRRLTHALTEPVQALPRRLLRRLPTGGWDLSPLAVLVLLGGLRLWMIRL